MTTSTSSRRGEKFTMESFKSSDEFFRDFDKTTKEWMEDSDQRFKKWKEEQEKVTGKSAELSNGRGESNFGGFREKRNDEQEFRVTVDVKEFKPEEITVKTVDNELVVTAKHEENKCEHGKVSRQFTKRYTLPKDVDPYTVTSDLRLDGTLTISAPKIRSKLTSEHTVPLNFRK